MRPTSSALLLAASSSFVAAQSGYGSSNSSSGGNSTGSSVFPPFSGNPFQKYDLSAKGINASFIPYGARLTNLYVNDKYGNPQDVAVGYDEGTRYLQDSETNHTYFGAVVGRYANRIKNGTFTIDGETSHIPTNEHGGENTLHGGFVGYDQANWTVVSHTGNSITFSYYDEGLSGFPGDVLNVATYTLADDASFISRLVSIPVNEATPIMLANHIYWNLGAFVDQEALTINSSTLQLPYADRWIPTDGIQIPNGTLALTNGTGLDFQQPNITIGQNLPNTEGFCGTGCTGIDNAFINDRSPYSAPYDPNLEVLKLWAPSTGIQLDLSTNQGGLQIYTCIGQNGTIPVKQSQQHLNSTTYVGKFGCIVIETQDWIDGINQPQWGREQYQIFSPTTEPAVNYAKYKFSVVEP